MNVFNPVKGGFVQESFDVFDCISACVISVLILLCGLPASQPGCCNLGEDYELCLIFVTDLKARENASDR